jgi:predicted AlkP superfamily phosphohydrolase/phosphomutase
MATANRVIMLGLDALVPNTTLKLIAEGSLPRLKQIYDQGCFSRMLPAIPAQTPSNWNTLATGATPGTHGVVQWGSHLPGEEIWEFHRSEAFNSGLCRAEYLWETAARAGKRSVVMNYAGYPSTTESALYIERLFRPGSPYFDLSRPTVYHNCPELNTQDPLYLKRAEGWSNGPETDLPLLEAELPVATTTRGEGPRYHLLVHGSSRYDRISVCSERDGQKAVCTLEIGQWSSWLTAPFSTDEQGDVEGTFRFKLIELSPDARRLRLYRSGAFPTDGRLFSDQLLGKKLMNELGPFVHGGQPCHLHMVGQLDWETTREIMDDVAAWWSRAAELAMAETKASLFVLHWHVLDSMGHSLVPKIDPTGGEYDPDTAEHYWGIVKSYYEAADRFVGAFLDRFDDGETAIAVVSDHGMPANIKAVSLINLFRGKGWVPSSQGEQSVDWSKSRLFFSQNHLWVNLEGRDKGGLVPAAEYDELRREVIAAMRDVKDPETGEHVFAFVLAREDAPMVGLWGEYIGDVVFCYAGGYRWSGAEVLRLGEERIVFPCGGGNHGPMIPTYETDTTSVLATLLMKGPGIKKGFRLPDSEQARIRTADVAPTLSWLLGLPHPAQNEGRILHDFLEEFSSEFPERILEPTERAIVNRPGVKPTPIPLQGDVTDEGGA